ncbi:hypothetical protein D9M72_536240 [compost metagenome]
MLPAAPPPVESEDTVRLAALHSPCCADAGDDGDDAAGVLGGWLADGADEAAGVLDVEAAPEVPWGCGWLGPQAVSRKAAAATAVVMANPFLIG